MDKSTKVSIFLLRVALGVVLFSAGVSRVFASSWSPNGYLDSAKTFPGFFHWLSLAQNAGWVVFLNEWGLLLLGAALILGIFVRFDSCLGVLLMILYYLPAFSFPYASQGSFIIDEHFVYALIFLLLFFSKAGHIWGVDSLLFKKSSPNQ